MTEEENNDPIEISIEEQLRNSEDKYLRIYAEFENYKKRVQKEKDDLVSNTKTRMLTAVLDVDSDITIAVKSIKNKEAKQGVSLIAQKLESFLKTQGIETVQTDTYDDELHEVISVLKPGGKKIIDVVTKGYTLNGKIFRYPKIVLGE
jgi:molecular chaperone GrpE